MTEGKPLSYPPNRELEKLKYELANNLVRDFEVGWRGGRIQMAEAFVKGFDAAVKAVRTSAFEEAAKLLDAEQGTWLADAPFGSAICAALEEYAKKIRARAGGLTTAHNTASADSDHQGKPRDE